MRRGLVLVLLLMTFMSQVLAMAGRADALGHIKNTKNTKTDSHAVLHWKGQAHHHQVDGTLALDDSTASTQHLLVDHVLAEPGLPSSLYISVPLVARAQLLPDNELLMPGPHLAGLRRPPRLVA
ncbi:MAG: hypothetical protein JSS56_08830 [Proteobacteria bacterium]|nr:hypothetical protein [Pseudomonadota bacterium]